MDDSLWEAKEKNNQKEQAGVSVKSGIMQLLIWFGLVLLIMFYPEFIVIPIMIVAMYPWILKILFGK